MPVTKKLISQNNNDLQWLKVDSNKRFVVNDNSYWQFLFGPNSAFTTSQQILKIAAEFNKEDFDTIRFAAYLYHPNSGTISNAAITTFNVYLVTTPDWTEQFVASFPGTKLSTSYFYADVPLTSLSPVDFFGGDTIMVEALTTRLSEVYRDRIYVNHLGIYDNITRLRQDVEFLDATKLDE